MLPRTVRISDIVEETRTVKTFVLDDKMDAQPGQFVMLWLPGVDEKPISIAAPDPLTLTVAKVGPFSNALHECKVGDLLSWRGPFGRALPAGRQHARRCSWAEGTAQRRCISLPRKLRHMASPRRSRLARAARMISSLLNDFSVWVYNCSSPLRMARRASKDL